MIGDLRASWHFTRKYRQFLQIANLTQGLVIQENTVSKRSRMSLNVLNRKKMACQAEIGELGVPSIADCAACTSGCCGDPSSYYFTPIDHWLARYGARPVYPYRELPQEPFHHIMQKRLMELGRRVIPVPATRPTAEPSSTERCQHCGVHGCVLPHEERPIKCHLFVCSRLRSALDDVTESAYIELTAELYSIARETFEVLKKEADLHPGYGVATVALSL